MEYNYFDPILDMDGLLEFVSPSHSGIEWLDSPQEYEVSLSMNAWHALYCQMIDGDQDATREMDNSKEHISFWVVDA